MDDESGEEHEKQLLKKILSYYKRSPYENLPLPKQSRHDADGRPIKTIPHAKTRFAKRRYLRVIVISVVVAVITTILLLITLGLLK